jgi:hypothetical protein
MTRLSYSNWQDLLPTSLQEPVFGTLINSDFTSALYHERLGSLPELHFVVRYRSQHRQRIEDIKPIPLALPTRE